jgi:uncharacterized UBP type Zn finger protein
MTVTNTKLPGSAPASFATCLPVPLPTPAQNISTAFDKEQRMAACIHVRDVRVTKTDKDYCEDCVLTGDTWLHLRMCLTCGHVGCCDSSPKRHARQHYQHKAHALVRSIEPGETWTWCYADELSPGDLEA